MHIVQLANFYGPRSGGLRTAVDELGRRYRDAGHTTSLIVPAEQSSVVEHPNRTVVTIASPLVPGLGGYRAIVDLGAVHRHLDRLRPDAIELSDKTTLVGPAARHRRRGVPVVLVSHERIDALIARAVPLRPVSERAARRFNRRLVRRVDAIVCASAYAKNEFDGLIPHGGPRRLKIPLGVDLDAFTPSTRARGEPPRIVAAVRLSPEKSPELLLGAARALRDRGVDVRWDIHGDGPLRADLEQRSSSLPIRYHGFTDDRAALAAAMADADIGVAPGRFETFGLAALEFLSAGTPVVVPDRGALREIVTETTGSVCAPNGAAFARGIESLLAGDRNRQRIASRRLAAGYCWSATADRMLDLFVSLRAADVAVAS